MKRRRLLSPPPLGGGGWPGRAGRGRCSTGAFRRSLLRPLENIHRFAPVGTPSSPDLPATFSSKREREKMGPSPIKENPSEDPVAQWKPSLLIAPSAMRYAHSFVNLF
jgi:hypothetical protein